MTGRVAFVLGGGGVLGAAEVGMLDALVDAGVEPQLVIGTSVGAINGSAYALDPTPSGVQRLRELWTDHRTLREVLGGRLLSRTATLVRSRTHLQEPEAMRRMLTERLGDRRIEDLPVPFQCVAASIERSAEHWFTRGPLTEAVLASCAVPGLMAPVRIGDEHYLDGGLVASIPVHRAVALGATTVYVLHVGRIESPLRPPRQPWEVALVAFEIARRHRFASTMADLPDGVEVHVLPTGGAPIPFTDLRQLRNRDLVAVPARIETAYEASRDYLAASL